MMKKLLAIMSILAFGVYANETITIAATKYPHAQILEEIKPDLAKEGYDLKIIEYSNYKDPGIVTERGAPKAQSPNDVVYKGKIDANFFQHQPYLDAFNKGKKKPLVPIAKVLFAPLGIYANKDTQRKFIDSKNINDLSNPVIGIPSDPTNNARALKFLDAAGIIVLKMSKKPATVKDIISNPHEAKIVAIDPSVLPKLLKEDKIDLAIINAGFALKNGLSLEHDAVMLEKQNDIYANIVVVRPDEVNQPKIKALAKAINSPQVRDYIEKEYQGALIPSF